MVPRTVPDPGSGVKYCRRLSNSITVSSMVNYNFGTLVPVLEPEPNESQVYFPICYLVYSLDLRTLNCVVDSNILKILKILNILNISDKYL